MNADSKDDAELIATADLLSLKPIIYAANMDEDGFADKDSNKYYQARRRFGGKGGRGGAAHLRQARAGHC